MRLSRLAPILPAMPLGLILSVFLLIPMIVLIMVSFFDYDSVQIIPADLTLQDILDIWDGLGPKYRLSIGYVLRVVRVDRSVTPGLPVVATRFGFQNGGTA